MNFSETTVESMSFSFLTMNSFVLGDPKTNAWAKKRADLGHPAPYKVDVVYVDLYIITLLFSLTIYTGNLATKVRNFPFRNLLQLFKHFSDYTSITYDYRWQRFYDALKAVYPNVTYLATGTLPGQKLPAVDVHDFSGPDFFHSIFDR